MADAIRLEGFREFQRALARSDSVIKKGFRKSLREAAQPVAQQATVLALMEIPRMTARWSRMRVGVTQKFVYVAPRQKGTKIRPMRRPNLADKLRDEAMRPAFLHNREAIAAHVEELYDQALVAWKTGG